MYIQKIHFITSIVFEILKFKNLQSVWPRAFLYLTRQSNFYQTRGFSRIMEVMKLHDLDSKNLQINGLFFFVFLQNPNKPYFLDILGHYSHTEIFPQKIRLCQFLPLRHPNFMRSFKKPYEPLLRKWVYLLTY